jgi:hypothetical protein
MAHEARTASKRVQARLTVTNSGSTHGHVECIVQEATHKDLLLLGLDERALLVAARHLALARLDELLLRLDDLLGLHARRLRLLDALLLLLVRLLAQLLLADALLRQELLLLLEALLQRHNVA